MVNYKLRDMESESFSVIDYAIFGMSLLLSLLTGVYFAFKDKIEESTNNYFLGEQEMSPITVGLSLAVSCVSALTIMGLPFEVYLYGNVWFWLIISLPIAVFIASNYFVPIYRQLNIKSVYNYLELRFHKNVRLICSLGGLIYLTIYMSTVAYLPVLSLTALTPINLYVALAITLGICTIYTTIGGFKSVIWADTLQSVIMITGYIMLLVCLIVQSGGISEVFAKMKRGNRNNFVTLSTDPYLRCSTWSIVIYGCSDWVLTMATNQAYVQRYMACKNINAARKSLFISLIPQITITLLALSTGVALYSYFEKCDPVKDHEIAKYDQLVPYAVAKITESMPGMSGLFVAAVYSGTLSTISSGINSMTVIIVEDFMQLIWKFRSEYKKLIAIKLISLGFGFFIFFTSIAISFVEGTLIQITFTVLSALGSFLLSIFILGIFVPWANTIGTLCGSAVGFVITLWLSLGSLLHISEGHELEISTEYCNVTDVTNSTASTTLYNVDIFTTSVKSQSHTPYDISFMYFRAISMVISIPIAVIISFLTGANNPKDLNPKLFQPLIQNAIFPRRLNKLMRCGVPEANETKPSEEVARLTTA